MFHARILAVLALAPLLTVSGQSTDPYLARARAVLRSTPLVDGHNDLPWRIREDSVHPNDIEAYDLRKRTRYASNSRR